MDAQEARTDVLTESQANTRERIKNGVAVKYDGSWWILARRIGGQILITGPKGWRTVYESEVEPLE